MPISSPDLFWPSLGSVYQALAPCAAALLRIIIGLMLVPHGLRGGFGFFRGTGAPRTPDRSSFAQFAAALARQGYWPSYFWAALACFTEMVAGPMLALGLFTRPAGFAIFLLLAAGALWHWRAGHGYFWNTIGFEFPLMWAIVALFFAVAGGGPYSLDRVLLGYEF